MSESEPPRCFKIMQAASQAFEALENRGYDYGEALVYVNPDTVRTLHEQLENLPRAGVDDTTLMGVDLEANIEVPEDMVVAVSHHDFPLSPDAIAFERIE